MGKEKFVRSKPHVNIAEDPEPGLVGTDSPATSSPVVSESLSLNFAKFEPLMSEPVEPGELKAPPAPGDAAASVGAAQTITVGGVQTTSSALPDGSMPYESLTLSAEDAAGFHPDGTPLRAKVDPTPSPHDTHEIEEVSLTYQKIELEATRRPAPVGDGTTEQFFTVRVGDGFDDPAGPSTLAHLEPQEPGVPGELTTEAHTDEVLIGMLVPAIQKIGDEPGAPDDLELDL